MLSQVLILLESISVIKFSILQIPDLTSSESSQPDNKRDQLSADPDAFRTRINGGKLFGSAEDEDVGVLQCSREA